MLSAAPAAACRAMQARSRESPP